MAHEEPILGPRRWRLMARASCESELSSELEPVDTVDMVEIKGRARFCEVIGREEVDPDVLDGCEGKSMISRSMLKCESEGLPF